MEPFEIMVSESQERMLCVSTPDNVAAVLAVCEQLGGRGDGRSARSPTPRRMRVLRRRRGGRRHAGDGAGRRLPALRPRARAAARASRCTPRRPRRCSRPEAGRAAARAARALRTSPRAGRCSSSTTRSCSSRTVRRPEQADAAVLALAATATAIARVDRRQRPPGGRRPVHRHRRGGARVRGQPRLRRRRAARPDQLPELRQPREAAHRLAADRVGRRPGRRLPRARRAGRRRQRVAVQRGRRGPDLPDAGRRDGRRAARPARAAAGWRSSPRATPSLSSGRSRRRSPARELAKLRGEPLAGPLPVDIAAVGARTRPSATRSARGQLASAHDIAEGGLAVALAECCLAGGSAPGSTSCPAATSTLFGEAPGGVRRLGRARGARAALPDAVVSARSAAMR